MPQYTTAENEIFVLNNDDQKWQKGSFDFFLPLDVSNESMCRIKQKNKVKCITQLWTGKICDAALILQWTSVISASEIDLVLVTLSLACKPYAIPSTFYWSDFISVIRSRALLLVKQTIKFALLNFLAPTQNGNALNF